MTDLVESRRLEQLEKRVAELQALLACSNAQLDEFAFIASHDLKEPLGGLSLTTGLLLDSYADKLDKEGRELLSTVGALARRSDRMIDALREYMLMNRQGMNRRTTDLNELVAQALDSLKQVLDDKNIDVRLSQSLPRIDCDSDGVGQVFSHLIMNAIAFNEASQKWVEIGCAESPPPGGDAVAEAVIFVRDNGIGIDPGQVSAAFRMFSQLHPPDEYVDGVGAGLALSRKIVQLHGGRIWVDSAAGDGCTVYFTLQ